MCDKDVCDMCVRCVVGGGGWAEEAEAGAAPGIQNQKQEPHKVVGNKCARLPQFFEVGNIKNEAILRDFFQKWKGECRADGLVTMRFAFFPFHLSKVIRMPPKSEARSYEVLCQSHKIILPNLKI